MFGKMVFARRHAWAVFAAMFVVFALGVAVNLPAEQHGVAVLRSSGVNITMGNGQSGGNMADKEVRFGQAATAELDRRDERRLERVGQRRLRREDAARRSCAPGQPVPRRGDLRRRRLGPLRDVLLHRHRGVRRRADGRADAGMAGQEDRGARDQIRGARRALRADDGARRSPRSRSRPSPGSRRSSTAASTASPRRSMPTTRSRTTTAAPSPASG